MYLDHFGLYTAPFSLVPHLRFLYLSTAFEETMAHLLYGLEGGEDIILITGEIGSGKTLALFNLASNIKGQYQVAVVNKTQVEFNELLKLVLADQGITTPAGSDRADLLILLTNYLEKLSREGKRLLLIIDEAQNLDVATLEGVRLLTNLGPGQAQRLQLILAGQPGLRKKIDLPELAQVRQRIRVHYHLESLSRRETEEYIAHRLRVAGRDKPTFTSAAIEVIHRRSCGVPRLVSILADKALLAGYVDGTQSIGPEHVPDEDFAFSPTEELDRAERAAQHSEAVTPEPPAAQHSDEAPDTDEAPEPDGVGEPVWPPEVAKVRPVDASLEDTDRAPRSGRRYLMIAAAVLVAVAVVYGVWRTQWADSAEEQNLAESERVTQQAETPAVASTDSQVVETPADSVDIASSPALGADAGPFAADAPLDSAAVAAGAASSELPPSEPDAGEFSAAEQDPALELVGPCVHVASFRENVRALTLQARLAEVSPRTAIQSVVIEGETWYRLYSGPWDSMDEAQRYQAVIREARLSDWTLLVVLK